jgi:hypothetical protein
MKKLFFILLAFLSTSFSFAQSNSFYITGTVINAETKAPMQGASVFAENTTFGTATDADGKFTLQLPNGGYGIVVSFTGFNSWSQRVSNTESQVLLVSMTPKEKMMQEVSIVSTGEVKNGWEKYGKVFTDEFLGKSINGNSCTIKNPETLKFFYSKRKGRLKVMAEDAIIIQNDALGYTIKYQLDSFVHERTVTPVINTIIENNNDVTVYTGFPLFEEMTSTDSVQLLKWAEARKKAYNGSVLHFMRSLYDMQLAEEGFEIQFIVKMNDNDTALKLKDFYGALNVSATDSISPITIMPNQPAVGVIYRNEKPSEAYLKENEFEPSKFQFSTLNFLPRKQISIEQNGYYFEQNDLTFTGYWSWMRMGDALPYDYEK